MKNYFFGLFALVISCGYSQANQQLSAQSPCSISNVIDINIYGEDDVVFYVIPQLASGWTVSSSTFKVTYQNGNVLQYTGNTNYTPYPNIQIPVYSSNKVTKVVATVISSNGSLHCSYSRATLFTPAVGGSGGSPFFSSVSPNPSSDQLTVEIDQKAVKNSKKTELHVYGLSGKLLQSHLVENTNRPFSFDISTLEPGTYMLYLVCNEALKSSTKFIVSKR